MKIVLSLVSHTNVGKTSLARTLLGRDVGTVRDEPHVTDRPEAFELIATTEGKVLELWDTPGFGDSARLARRLAQQGAPIGWLLSQVWDRLRDRAFWHTQQAVRHVADEADVVLYLVNASEAPQDAGYLPGEMQVLDLLGKPVLVLLNQLGPPRPPEDEARQVARWREHLARFRVVQEVLPLDAFARCWVQETQWLQAVGRLLPEDRRAAFGALVDAWTARRLLTFEASMQLLAARLARAAIDKEPVDESGLRGRLREAVRALARELDLVREGEPTPREAAMAQLAQRLDEDVRSGNDRLIALHELGGHARARILERLAEHFAVREPVSEGRAALLGGALAGALAGLKADLATGGLTLGGGLLTGGVLGALGAAGMARGVNLLRGTDRTWVSWSDDLLLELAESALVTYLAVAHYGRGRGDWVESENPSHWEPVVKRVLESMRSQLVQAWADRAGAAGTAAIEARLQPVLAAGMKQVLTRLYPAAMGGGGPWSRRTQP